MSVKNFAKNTVRRFNELLHYGLVSNRDLDAYLDRFYDQIFGLQQIQNAMAGRPVLKPMRHWAISPDAMVWILSALQDRERPTVIEFGSGQSTAVLAATLRHRNGQLISVEHDQAYANQIRSQIAASKLEDTVNFIHAPLTTAASCTSYDLSNLPETSIDIALIDGPPSGANGQLTRLTPLRWAAQNLKRSGVIFLDDASRVSEQSCITTLLAEYEDLEAIHRKAEKGLIELRFKQPNRNH